MRSNGSYINDLLRHARGEWFGLEYLPLILAFAGGLADGAPELRGGDVRSPAEVERMRRDIERVWLAGHSEAEIAEYTFLDADEVDAGRVVLRRQAAGRLRRPCRWHCSLSPPFEKPASASAG